MGRARPWRLIYQYSGRDPHIVTESTQGGVELHAATMMMYAYRAKRKLESLAIENRHNPEKTRRNISTLVWFRVHWAGCEPFTVGTTGYSACTTPANLLKYVKSQVSKAAMDDQVVVMFAGSHGHRRATGNTSLIVPDLVIGELRWRDFLEMFGLEE